MNRWKEFATFLGVGFEKEFGTNENKEIYKIDQKGISWLVEGSFYHDHILVSHFIQGTLTPRWTPSKGESFYYPSFASCDLVDADVWESHTYDLMTQQNVGVYKSKEDAAKKAAELGWRKLRD